jgi:hypothetical protein
MMAPIHALRALGWLDGYDIVEKPTSRAVRLIEGCSRPRSHAFPRSERIGLPGGGSMEIKAGGAIGGIKAEDAANQAQRANRNGEKKRALLAVLQEIGWIDANFNVRETLVIS